MGLPFLQTRATLTGFDEFGVLVYLKIVDVMVSEVHTAKAKVSRHPVGKGIPVADNVRPEPAEFTCKAFFTNTPATIDEIAKKIASGLETVGETFEELAGIVALGWTFTIKTSFRTYDNMVLESISAPRSVDRSTSIEVDMKFVEFTKASSLKVGIPAKTPIKKKNGSKAPKGPKPKTNPVKSGSTLHKIKEAGSKIITRVVGG